MEISLNAWVHQGFLIHGNLASGLAEEAHCNAVDLSTAVLRTHGACKAWIQAGVALKVKNAHSYKDLLDRLPEIVYYVVHMTFGRFVRSVRDKRFKEDRSFSVRQVAQRIGVEPSYLSKIERDQVAPPSEATIRRLAGELGEDADLLLAMAGKVSSDLRNIILQRPQLFAELLRQLRDAPDHAIESVAREIRDGNW